MIRKEPSTSTDVSFTGEYNEEILNVNKICWQLENKWDMKYIQILPAPGEGAAENIGQSLR